MRERNTKKFKNEHLSMVSPEMGIDEIYIFSQMLRKELLSDILEIESLISARVNEKFEFTKYDLSYLINLNKFNDESFKGSGFSFYLDLSLEEYNAFFRGFDNLHQMELLEFDLAWSCRRKDRNEYNDLLYRTKNNIAITTKEESLFKSHSRKLRKRRNTKISDLIENKTFGGLLKIVESLSREKIFNIFEDVSIKLGVSDSEVFVESYFMPLLNYLKELRNGLAHCDLNLTTDFLEESWMHTAKPSSKKFLTILKELKLFLSISHNETFYSRFRRKVSNNEKLNFSACMKILNNTSWEKI